MEPIWFNLVREDQQLDNISQNILNIMFKNLQCFTEKDVIKLLDQDLKQVRLTQEEFSNCMLPIAVTDDCLNDHRIRNSMRYRLPFRTVTKIKGVREVFRLHGARQTGSCSGCVNIVSESIKNIKLEAPEIKYEVEHTLKERYDALQARNFYLEAQNIHLEAENFRLNREVQQLRGQNLNYYLQPK